MPSEPVTPPRARSTDHIVFLVPGLLGFEAFSTFGYFADRVSAALRASLEQRWKVSVPVVAVPIPPTASLAERQHRLVKTLADRVHAIEQGGRPLQIHLVGHSTGGVDASLLTRDAPLQEGSWNALDTRAPALLERLRTVVSIASPHQGACIAVDPVGRFLSERDWRGFPGFTKLLARFAVGAFDDVELTQLVLGSQREGGKALRFFQQVLSRWSLLTDLEPADSWGRDKSQSRAVRRSFVTITGNPSGGVASPADEFFLELSARASGVNTGATNKGKLVHAAVDRLRAALDISSRPGALGAADGPSSLVIKAPGIELPRIIDAAANDGVVNSARQLIDPSDPRELAGIVVADHFDVVGYYDRHVWQTDDKGQEQSKQIVSGFLHSGCAFRDDEFFTLYRRVAEVIAEAVET